jgi:pimeloyl-ACP methyl ester carboxylesterase
LLIALASCQSTPEKARVKIGDITMYYEVHGKGEPLILLHGGFGSVDDWSNQVPVFSKQYCVITPDSRGQ